MIFLKMEFLLRGCGHFVREGKTQQPSGRELITRYVFTLCSTPQDPSNARVVRHVNTLDRGRFI